MCSIWSEYRVAGRAGRRKLMLALRGIDSSAKDVQPLRSIHV